MQEQISKLYKDLLAHTGKNFSICRTVYHLAILCATFPLYSTPDLTIVGFFEAEGGIGKVPVTIVETLGKQASINFIATGLQRPLKHQVPPSVIRAMQNRDASPGKVALLTDLIWDHSRCPAKQLPKESVIKLAYSMLETTQIPSMWVKTLNEELDAVVVPDESILHMYIESGVKIPIFVLPIPMMLDPFYKHTIHPNFPSKPFIFGDASANKNPAALIEAFARAFGNNPNVHLVMRAGRIFQETRDITNRLISQYGLKNVTLEEGHLLFDQYMDRLSSFDCFINLSRGEGFSFVPREALALGIPVIITDNTASKTICASGFVRAVPTNKKGPTGANYLNLFLEECGEQFDCEVEDVVAALNDVYKNYEIYIKKARKGRKWVDQYNTSNPKLQRQFLTLIKPKQVVMGKENAIKNGTIFTSSPNLYEKYQKIISSRNKD